MPVPLIAVVSVGGKIAGALGIGKGGPSGTTHAQRTLAAADGSAAQRTLVQQAWGHVLQARSGTIADGPYWLQVWQELRGGGGPGLQQLLNQVSGELTGSSAPASSLASLPFTPSAAPAGGPSSFLSGGLGTLVLIALVIAAAVYFFRRR